MIQALIISGPTASGKSGLALELAQKYHTDIISADSVQVYKYLNIGSAKPGKAVLDKVPHHLIDLIEPDAEFDAGTYLNYCEDILPEIISRNKLILFAGGTGLYLKAVIDGLVDMPGKNQAVRDELYRAIKEGRRQELFQRLKKIDPVYAEKIHYNDNIRLVRALEVHQVTGKPLSVLHNSTQTSFPDIDFIQIGIFREKAELSERINQRVERMFHSGFIEEVDWLINQKGYSPDLKSLKSLGYYQVAQYLRGQLSLEETKNEIKKQTRYYAKRQMTWLKRDQRIKWFRSNSASLADEISAYLAANIK